MNLGKEKNNINPLLSIRDQKTFEKSWEQIESFVAIFRVSSTDIRTEFGLTKYGLLVVKRGTFIKYERITLLHELKMKQIYEGG